MAAHPLLAHAHVEERLVPALDYAARADGEAEGRAPIIRRVELRAVEQVAGVVRLDALAGGGLHAIALLKDLVL